MQRLRLILATGFGTGYLPKISGTAGTVPGVLLYLLFKDLPAGVYIVTVGAFIFLASWAATYGEIYFQKKDAQKITVDEVAGFLVTMILVPFSWLNILLGFILFRIFDVWKPYPIRLIEKKIPGGWGVVGDDLLAGVYANICLQVALTLI